MRCQTKNCTRSGAVIAVVAGVFLLLFAVGSGPAAVAPDPAVAALRATGKAFASVAKQVSPSVVGITVEKKITSNATGGRVLPFGGPSDQFGDDLLRRFFGEPTPDRDFHTMGQGSGFIVTSDGYILTNSHVVTEATRVTVRLHDGSEYNATVVGTDPRSDVAVIKIDARDLPAVTMADSDTVEVGEWVVAVGNPFGLSHSVTAGIVSARGRSSVGIADYEDFIQTDAAINPGNSGGPLVNLEGKVVGVNTAILSRTGGAMGVGFAIPANMAKQIYDQLRQDGTVTRGFLGVVIQNLTKDLAEIFGLGDTTGLLIAQVSVGSPAARGGFKQGDVIVELNAKPVEQIGRFRNRIALMKPGTEATFGVVRAGKPITITVAVGALESDGPTAVAARPETTERLGVTVKTLTPDLAEQLGAAGDRGVLITQVQTGSIAAAAGLRPGTIVKEVNKTPVTNVEEFKKALENRANRDVILLLLKDKEYERFLTLRPEN